MATTKIKEKQFERISRVIIKGKGANVRKIYLMTFRNVRLRPDDHVLLFRPQRARFCITTIIIPLNRADQNVASFKYRSIVRRYNIFGLKAIILLTASERVQ